jgi:signal transduction histidine kinase/PAS domain-containing protein
MHLGLGRGEHTSDTAPLWEGIIDDPGARSPEAGTCTIILNMDGRIVSADDCFERALRRTSAQLTGMKFLDLVAKADMEVVWDAIGLTSNGVAVNGPVVADLLQEDGTEVSFELGFVPSPAEGGPILVHAKEIESGPMHSGDQSSFATVARAFELTSTLALAVDLKGNVKAVSPAASKLLGIPEVRGSTGHLGEFMDMRGGEGALQQALKAAGAGQESTIRATFNSPTGENVSVQALVAPVKAISGGVVGAIIISLQERGRDEKPAAPKDDTSNLEVLARASTDIVEAMDLSQAIDLGLDELTASLSLDFAVFRIIGPDGKPKMYCSGIDFKEGRKVLESSLFCDGPLYVCVEKGTVVQWNSAAGESVALGEGQVRSLVGLPIKQSDEVYGAAVFGCIATSTDIRTIMPVLQLFCGQVALSLRKASLNEQLVMKKNELESLHETSMALSGTLDYKTVLQVILAKAKELVRADNIHMFTVDKQHGKLRCLASISVFKEVVEGYELAIGEGITGIVARSGKGMLIERADRDERSKHVNGTPDDPSSLISVPLKMGDEVLGVVTLERVPGVPFSQEDYRIIELFSVQAATAVNNASMFDRINQYASTQQMYNILLTHDVANYNVPIHGFLEMLVRDPKLDERQMRFVRSALAQSENISNLINDVRKLSLLRSIESNKDLAPVDLSRAVGEAVQSLRMNALYEMIEIRYEPPAEAAVVLGDAFVKDVAYNILGNACKYGGAGPIEVDLQPVEENGKRYWRLGVMDTGKGIPEDRKKFLFRRFDQFDPGTASEGHGIGLSVVSALCDRYGGRVWVEDRVEGDQIKGSVFRVLLPRSNN